jgi:NTP pyrophosphatase (non-canonical NTP hydrolase)
MKEIGDVLWYLSELSSQFGFDLDDVANMNIDKLASRKLRGAIGGSGDNR